MFDNDGPILYIGTLFYLHTWGDSPQRLSELRLHFGSVWVEERTFSQIIIGKLVYTLAKEPVTG